MSWFGKSKMDDEAGQWAAMAMACMVFADGSAEEAEIAAARAQVQANPVLHESIGSGDAERLFKESVDAIKLIPATMLPTYEVRLAGLAAKISDVNSKNFALATVIAVAMGDGALTAAEHQMAMRFHKMLGASIPVPEPGGAATPEVKQVQPVAPSGATSGCSTCGGPTQLYQGRGVWCARCQRWQSGPEAAGAQPTSSQAQRSVANAQAAAGQHQQAQQVAGSQPSLGFCPNVGTKLVPYPGYGPYCSTCRQVIPAVT
jgi:hypothetical protein